jgi:hypothetical protein
MSISNYIFASSRGRDLQAGLDRGKSWVYVRSGARLAQLTNTAEYVIGVANKSKKVSGHAYFLAGIPDLTIKIADKKEMYQEVIFMGSVPESVPKMEADMVATAGKIKQLGWKPVFCPIVPMSLKDWNSPDRTSYLIHYHQYSDMQALLEETIIAINHIIRAINKSNHVYTPNIQKQIIKVNHGQYSFRYNRLHDGCHPNEQLVGHWCKTLNHAISTNDQRAALHQPGPIASGKKCPNTSVEDSTDTDSEADSRKKRNW